jgi:nucleoside-diphosphate-sugar epimerase
MKRVLVTGASGRIGRALVPLLLAKGYRVRAMVNQRPLPEEWRTEVESVHGPLTDDAALANAVADAGSICHLAGLMPPAPDDDIFRTNIESTYRLLQAAARLSRKRASFSRAPMPPIAQAGARGRGIRQSMKTPRSIRCFSTECRR